jgi:hypothetical protein
VSGSSDLTVTGGGAAEFSGPLSGSADLTFEGSGPVQLSAVNTGVDFENTGTDSVGGALGSSANITLDNPQTVVQMSSGFSGTGAVNVTQGTLVTDEAPGAAGSAGFSGTITIGTGGTVKNYDSVDVYGLGTGTIFLDGGLLQNSSGATTTMGNPVTVDADSTISSRGNRLKFSNNLNLDNGETLTLVGSLALTGSLTGSGAIILNSGQLAVASSNPSFTGNVTVNSGNIQVPSGVANTLGSGKLIASLTAQGVLQSVGSIVDPVMDNPLIVEAGTFDLDGQFTFPSGVTVETGATLVIEGATSSAVVSGPLTGGGTIIVDGGTFSAPGGSSGFSGTLQNSGGGKITPTLTITDAGGVFNGSPFAATGKLSAPGLSAPVTSLEGVSPTFTYYTGSSVSGTGTSTAPSVAGTYTVVGSFAGSSDYVAVQSSPVTFTITPAVSNKLVFSVPPRNSIAGEIGPVIVRIENSQGQLMISDDSTVTLNVSAGPGVLGGTVAVKAKDGVATFNRLLLTTAGTYTLKATDGAYTAAISPTFKITPAAPAKIVFVQQPSNASAGSSIGTLVLDVEDQYGNLETGFDLYVTLWLESESRWGSILYLTTARVTDGVVSFKGISVDGPGTYRLLAGAGPCVEGTSNSFTISLVARQPTRKCGS